MRFENSYPTLQHSNTPLLQSLFEVAMNKQIRFTLNGKNQTGVHRLAIQKYRARATVARAAAFFSAGHADLVAQQIEQQAVRGNFATDVLPVQRESDLLVHGNLKIKLEYWSDGTPVLHYSNIPFF